MSELLSEINKWRAAGYVCSTATGTIAMPAVSALSWNAALASAATVHSTDMAANNFFSHVGSNGSTFDQRITAAGYSWSAIAENIAAGNSTAAATVGQWLASSDGHCQAMMSATYVNVGGSCMYNASSTYRYYWTIDLGKP